MCWNNYAYYAQVELWSGHAVNNAEFELTEDELLDIRIIMSDMIFRYGDGTTFGGYYRYNHGKHGFSDFTDVTEPPELTGSNRLFGGGRVEWKSDYDVANMAEDGRHYEDPFIRMGNWGGTSYFF